MNNLYEYSLDDTKIVCNCDDEKTGFIDNNVLKSKNQLPVTGKIELINSYAENDCDYL